MPRESYDAEAKRCEKVARKACPVLFGLWDVLMEFEHALWLKSFEGNPDPRQDAAREALDAIAGQRAAALDFGMGWAPRQADLTEIEARVTLERLGLLPERELVTICGDCLRESVGNHECAQQRRSNLRRVARLGA